jgi:hypothetical protein
MKPAGTARRAGACDMRFPVVGLPGPVQENMGQSRPSGKQVRSKADLALPTEVPCLLNTCQLQACVIDIGQYYAIRTPKTRAPTAKDRVCFFVQRTNTRHYTPLFTPLHLRARPCSRRPAAAPPAPPEFPPAGASWRTPFPPTSPPRPCATPSQSRHTNSLGVWACGGVQQVTATMTAAKSC